MSREHHWFKCFPEKWLGALAGMKPHVGYIYLIICLRIYETGHACTDSVETLATRTKLNKRWVIDAVRQLTASGKLVDTGEGLQNPFAERLLKTKENLGGASIDAFEKHASMPPTKSREESTNPAPRYKKIEGESPVVRVSPDSEYSAVADQRGLEVVAEAPFAFKRYPKPIDPHWTPSEKNRIDARAAGFADRDIERMTRAMVLHYRSRGQLLYDMDATWDKWVQNEAHWNGGRRGNGKGQRSGSVVDAWDRLSGVVESGPDHAGGQGIIRRLPERPVR